MWIIANLMLRKVISLSVEDWYVTFAHQTSKLMAFIALAGSKKSLFKLRSLNVFKMDLIKWQLNFGSCSFGLK